MTPPVPSLAVRTWRPQAFGRKNVRSVVDPLIEPLWSGDRVLLTVPGGGRPPVFADEEAEPLEGSAIADIAGDLTSAILADMVVLDGYLTRQATASHEAEAAYLVQAPTGQQMMAQLLIGRRASRGLAPQPAATDRSAPIAFVAVDLLALDDEPLLDVPLLERKRLLESAVEETHLVRRIAFVRPPVDHWLATWRALGFGQLAYKASNSRYRPGTANDDWALVLIPPAR